jgi:hypothetical protein
MSSFETEARQKAKQMAQDLHARFAADPAKADAQIMRHMSDNDRYSGVERVARIREAELARAHLHVMRDEVDRATYPNNYDPKKPNVAKENLRKAEMGLSPTGQTLVSQSMAAQMGLADCLTEESKKRWGAVNVRDLSADPKGHMVHKLPQRGLADIRALVATAALGLATAGLAHAEDKGLVDLSGIKTRLGDALGISRTGQKVEPQILSGKKPDVPKP